MILQLNKNIFFIVFMFSFVFTSQAQSTSTPGKGQELKLKEHEKNTKNFYHIKSLVDKISRQELEEVRNRERRLSPKERLCRQGAPKIVEEQEEVRYRLEGLEEQAR